LPDIGERQLLWVDVGAEGEERLGELGAVFGLAEDTVALLKEPSSTPRITAFPEYVHLTVSVLPDGSGEKPEPLDLVAGHNYVLTVHQGPVALLDDFDDRIRGDTHLGELDAASFLASLLHGHVTSYFRIAHEIEGTIDRIDARALHPRSQGDLLEELVRVRHRIARVRRSITPHREVLAALSGPEMTMIAESSSSQHYQALMARLERAIETVENTRQLLIGSFDIFMSRTAKRTNDTMKVLALAAIILLPASVLGGIMGMNFKVDLFENAANFYLVIGAMGLIGVGVLVVARLRGWI
jgi:Mg2+ and Co2+ transporter CorA